MDYLKYLFKEQDVYNLAELMSRSNDKRLITNVAISKIPYVSYPDCSTEQSLIIHELEEYLLKLAQNKNDSDEIAITLDLSKNYSIDNGMQLILENVGICYGSRNETDLFSDPQTMSIIRRAKEITIVNMHNHPSCSSFSVDDLSIFLKETAIKLMIILGNNGELYYLSKNKLYNHNGARKYLTDVAEMICPNIMDDRNANIAEMREISDIFLKNCQKFGMDYEHVLGSNRSLENLQCNTKEELDNDVHGQRKRRKSR